MTANAAAARLAVAAYLAELGTTPLPPGQVAGGADAERTQWLIELMGAHRQLAGTARNLNQAVAALHSTGAEPGQLQATADYVRAIRHPRRRRRCPSGHTRATRAGHRAG